MSTGLDYVDLTHLHENAKVLAIVAQQLGWNVRQGKGHTVVATSPVERTVTLLLTSQINQHKAKAAWAKLIRYSDPMKLIALQAWIETKQVDLGEYAPLWQLNEQSLTQMRANPPLPEPRRTPKAPKYARPAQSEHRPLPNGSPQPPLRAPTQVAATVTLPPPPVAPPVQRKPRRTIVSQRPWVAKQAQSSTGNVAYGYESETTIERHYSDGAVDYACAKRGCDYEADNPRSVTTHWGGRADHPPIKKPKLIQIDTYEQGHRSDESRIARLAKEIAGALAGVMVEPTDPRFAEALAEEILRDRDARRADREDEPSGPLTPEQIIERVRRLVDQGAYAQHIEMVQDQKEQIDQLTRDLVETREQCAEAQHRAEELQANWRALTELTREYGGDQ